ncbi:MAG: inorganic phosphate transporter, partial [Thermoplasmata archaeon]|nr:inorganic phosphate transporter [Thermoplasmata archaeon]
AKVAIPLYLLLIGAAGIAIGVFTWGYKVMKTVGFKITELTNTRGFSVDFGAATTVLLASKMGLPVSTTHAVVGAVMGVGLARGIGAVDFGVLKKIVISWAITLPIAALTAIGIFLLLWAVIPIPFI